MMSWTHRVQGHRRLVYAVFAVVSVVGTLAYTHIHKNLFPNTNRPSISVVTRWQGAVATDVAADLTRPMEARLTAVDGVRRVLSTSRDEVSSIQVEFQYGIDIDDAANRTTTEMSRITGQLPAGIDTPLFFKITDAAQPVMVLGLSAAEHSGLELPDIRRIAENRFRDAFLQVPGVSDLEIFGGDQRRIDVEVDRDKLEEYSLTAAQVASALRGANLVQPAGLVSTDGERVRLTVRAQPETLYELEQVLIPLSKGDAIRVSEVATLRWSRPDRSAFYHGNGHPAVAAAVMRSDAGYADEVLEAVDKALPDLRKRFPMLKIEVTDTQGRVIDLTVDNMLDALKEAIFMTLIVLLLFLGSVRAALTTAVSLPLTYLVTFLVMWAIGSEFNMVTLSAVIIAAGLLTDDVVVVIENIQRHLDAGAAPLEAAAQGTDEILLADTAGTVSTVVVLLPIMFVGGFVQRTLRPLTVSLSLALVASLVVSVTVIPLLASWMLRPRRKYVEGTWRGPLEIFDAYCIQPVIRLYVWLVSHAIRFPVLILLVALVAFGVSARQLKSLGRELMPRMDTGIMIVHYEAAPDSDEGTLERVAEEVDAALRAEIPRDWLLTISAVQGSEPGVRAFGAARRLEEGKLTVNLVDRFHRNRSLFDLNRAVAQRLKLIPELVSSTVREYGATPLSSLKASVDLMITGPDPMVLDRLAREAQERLATLPTITGTERSWRKGAKRLDIRVSPTRSRLYGLLPSDVARQTAGAVSGVPAGRVRVAGESSIPIRVRLKESQRQQGEALGSLPIRTPTGVLLPLTAMADIHESQAHTAETHQRLLPSVDVLGFRGNIPISHLADQVDQALEGMVLPRDYKLHREGSIKQMKESFVRLRVAILLAALALYLMLTITFDSFSEPLVIMACLPLALVGAAWLMSAAGKAMSMPAQMGFILLTGIVVNNGILLVDVIKDRLAQGDSIEEAVSDSVTRRTRPILMTAGSSIVGMIPIALERAVGIERMSPLAIVAIGGLIAGTILTLVVIPAAYTLLHRLRQHFGHPRGAVPNNEGE
jgi:multidrug efflux pump subunit AcrB